MKKFKEWRGTALMKKLKRFFASILCICMIITSCPDLLAWAAGDTAVVKPVTYRLTANSLSKMVRKAELEKTEENGLCKLKLPKGFNKTLGKTKLHVYLQPDEDSLVFVFENKADKRQGAALIVDNKKSDIFAIPTKAEIYEELGYEYASDSNADEDEIDSEGLLRDDFQELEAEIVDDAATGSDNNADEKYDYLEGYATHTILNNKKHTAGVAFTVSLDELGMDSLGELLPEEEDEDEIIATDSNAEETVPSVPEEIPTVTPPEVIEATPSDAIPVTVATPSNVAKTFIAEVGGVKIRAHAEAGVLPETATFHAIELKGTGDTADAFKEACKTLDEDEDTEYDGVMAYDLHFLDENKNEIEPDGEVQITMEVSQKALPAEADPTTIEVKHLAEEGDSLKVQTVADTADKAEGTVEVKEDVLAASEEEKAAETKAEKNATAVTAEFKVESFSYFVITFAQKNGTRVAGLKVTLLDENGNALNLATANATTGELIGWGSNGKQDPANLNSGYINTPRVNKWISIEETAATFGEKTRGYTYFKAYSDKACIKEIKWVYCRHKVDGYGNPQDDNNNGWYASNADDQPAKGNPGNTRIGDSLKSNNNEYGAEVFIKYKINADINTPIKDDIVKNGCLTYEYNVKTGIPTKFIWQYSNDGTNWKNVEGTDKPVTDDLFKVYSNENGTKLYPALDLKESEPDNLRKWYRVQIVENGINLPPTNPIQVPYYKALQNGSFETPDIKKLNQDGNLDVPNGTTGLEWRTTGKDGQVEIVRTDTTTTWYSSEYPTSWHGVYKAPDGKQFAELNAEREGALYQWVLTTPGTKLNWELYHQARTYRPDTNPHTISGNDTMYLVIAPIQKIEACLNPDGDEDKAYNYGHDELKEQIIKVLLEHHDADGYYNGTEAKYDGFYIQTISSKTDNTWYQNTGTYTVPKDGYLTSFFFVAGATASNNDTIGNMLDKVSFTTKLLPPQEGKTNIVVTKTVTGLMKKDQDNYKVKITLQRRSSNNTGNYGWTDFATQDLEFTSAGYAVAEFKDCDAIGYEYQVKEDDAKFIDKTTGESYTPEYNSPTSTYSTDKSAIENEYTMGKYVGITPESGQTQIVNFTNAYIPRYVSLSVEKKVTGNMGNSSQPFEFEITVKPKGTETSANIDGSYNGGKKTINDNKFSLSDGEVIDIDKIPYGATVTIKEINATGYTTTYILDNGAETSAVEMPATGYTFSSDDMKVGHRIKFINDRTIQVPSGLFDHGKPTGWWFLIIAAAGCLGFGVYRRKKKRNDGEECL